MFLLVTLNTLRIHTSFKCLYFKLFILNYSVLFSDQIVLIVFIDNFEHVRSNFKQNIFIVVMLFWTCFKSVKFYVFSGAFKSYTFSVLTIFEEKFHFLYLLKTSKIRDFLTFSGGTKVEN